MKNYKPEWLDPAPPRKISPAYARKKMDGQGPAGADATGAENGGDSQPQQPAAPVSLPLPPYLPPFVPRTSSGGHGR